MHLKRIFTILCYNLIVAFMCGALGSAVINYTYNNVGCDLIQTVEVVTPIFVSNEDINTTTNTSEKQIFIETKDTNTASEEFITKMFPAQTRQPPDIIDSS